MGGTPEGKYLPEFMFETRGSKREQIQGLAPDYMNRFLTQAWNSPNKQEYNINPEEVTNNLTRRNELPNENWGGWNPNVPMESIKLKTLDFAGEDTYNYGLGWKSQKERLDMVDDLFSPIQTSLPSAGSVSKGLDLRTELYKALALQGVTPSINIIDDGQSRVTVIMNMSIDNSFEVFNGMAK